MADEATFTRSDYDTLLEKFDPTSDKFRETGKDFSITPGELAKKYFPEKNEAGLTRLFQDLITKVEFHATQENGLRKDEKLSVSEVNFFLNLLKQRIEESSQPLSLVSQGIPAELLKKP